QLIYERWIGKYSAARLGVLTGLKTILEGGNEMATETAMRPRLVYQVFIKSTPEKVWDAITRPEFTTRYFFNSQFETDCSAGSSYPRTAGGILQVDGEVVEYDRPRRLVYTWHADYDENLAKDAPSRVTWELEGMPGDLTKLTVIHDDFEGETGTYE